MSVTLTGNGGLFVRLGHLFGAMADVVALKGGTATARVLSGASMQTRGTTIETDSAYSPAVSQQINPWTAIEAWQSAQGSLFQQFRTLAETLMIRQVDLDANLTSKDLTTALTELIRQMKANSDSLNGSGVSLGSQTDVGTPTGNPIFVLSIKRNDGYTLQTAFAETLRVSVTTDSQTGATARQETVTVKGKASVTDTFSHLWPGGSGASKTLTLADAQLDNSGGNKLYNSDFETFTSNYPEDWVIAVGSAGTDILAAGSSAACTGSNALKITGDGATLSCIRQTFNTAHSTTSAGGGTPYVVLPGTSYAVNFVIKAITAAPAAGVLRVRLVDGSNSVIADDAGTDNSFTVDLTAIDTSFVAYNGVFRTPSVLPSTVKLELALTTAITDTKSVVLDDLCLTPMTQLYNGGPFIAGFAGSDNTYLGDQWTFAIGNTLGVMASWLERVFALRDKGLQFPYDDGGTETIADSLVV